MTETAIIQNTHAHTHATHLTHTHQQTHTHTKTYTHTRTHTQAHTHTHTQSQTHTNTNAHTHTHTHTNTPTHRQPISKINQRGAQRRVRQILVITIWQLKAVSCNDPGVFP